MRSVNPKENVPKIEVRFADGTIDRMVLRHHNPIPDSKMLEESLLCNYLGHMQQDPLHSQIAVTGCLNGEKPEEKMYITLLSKKSKSHKTFSFDLRGNFTYNPVTLPPDYNDMKEFEPDTNNDGHIEERQSNVPYTIQVRLRIGFDKSALDAPGNIYHFLADILTHTQAHYLDPTLNHRIYFDVS